MIKYVKKTNGVITEYYQLDSFSTQIREQSVVAHFSHVWIDGAGNIAQEFLTHVIDDRLGSVVEMTITDESVQAITESVRGKFKIDDPATWKYVIEKLPIVDVPDKKYFSILMRNKKDTMAGAIIQHFIDINVFPEGSEWSIINEF